MCDKPIVRPPIALGIAPTERAHPPALVACVVGKKRVAQAACPGDADERDHHGPIERWETAGLTSITHETDVFGPFVCEQVAEAGPEGLRNLVKVR